MSVGFFSLSVPDDPLDYTTWHQTDHMPEQLRLSGIRWGQRFVATAACVASGVRPYEPMSDATHLQMYLMDGSSTVLDEFMALARELDDAGRMRRDIRASLSGAFDLVEVAAATGGPVTAEAVPYRPARGVHLTVVDLPSGNPGAAISAQARDTCLATDGVVGCWTFAADIHTNEPNAEPEVRVVNVIYLDGDPAALGPVLTRALSAWWEKPDARLRISSPFRSVIPPPADWVPADAGDTPPDPPHRRAGRLERPSTSKKS